MSLKPEEKFPLPTPAEGYVAQQVDMFGNGTELERSYIHCRNAEVGVYMAVCIIANNVTFSDSTKEKELRYSAPYLTVGWETTLDPRSFFEKAREVLSDRKAKSYDWLFIDENDSVTHSKNIEDALRFDRHEITLGLKPRDSVSWEKSPEDQHIMGAFDSLDPFDVNQDTLTRLMEGTATPDKCEAILASLEPFSALYREYVEIDFHE
jgi:hypothetical protein